MHALTNSGAVLLGVLLFFLFILLAELSYILCRPSPSQASKEVLLQFLLCFKKQNRIEPTGNISIQMGENVVTAEEQEEEEVDKWRASRLLFTIQEEEEEDDDEESEVRVDVPVEYSGDPTPFLTPCDSPLYFTPSPSPCRDIDDVINVCDVVSSSNKSCFNFQSSSSQMC